MDQERGPETAHEDVPLSAAERAAVAELAGRVAAEDPEFARRLDRFGGYDVSPLGLPSRWTAVPAALVAALIALGALFGMTVGADEPPAPGSMNSLRLE
ncbi:DUF3040 domain-containing protein [Actinocorallia sp. A-T 12471]|uniref:DUF3040 domain-containing protein n=1 Tax=Actinocorallia sp. A-T 12471 TaxID=3089813 RepID=UPI0029CB97CF|nr:DUF3040 domain-containing protein [Actinocorallia sp. A-T 12471]MDX6740553.1 DUF3040 domain-containing protein [Actinocorallia sp. A-T 12471]